MEDQCLKIIILSGSESQVLLQDRDWEELRSKDPYLEKNSWNDQPQGGDVLTASGNVQGSPRQVIKHDYSNKSNG